MDGTTIVTISYNTRDMYQKAKKLGMVSVSSSAPMLVVITFWSLLSNIMNACRYKIIVKAKKPVDPLMTTIY